MENETGNKGKSRLCLLHIQKGNEVTSNSKEIKPIALTIDEFCLAEGISQSVGRSAGWLVGQSVGRSVSQSVSRKFS